jgi:exodeoxyribonuclease VII large subunit
LLSPEKILRNQQYLLTSKQKELNDAMKRYLVSSHHTFTRLTDKMNAVSPLATLSRGYSITQNAQGDVIHDANDVKQGDLIVTRLKEGEIRSIVK